jgi:hypothetical protein
MTPANLRSVSQTYFSMDDPGTPQSRFSPINFIQALGMSAAKFCIDVQKKVKISAMTQRHLTLKQVVVVVVVKAVY